MVLPNCHYIRLRVFLAQLQVSKRVGILHSVAYVIVLLYTEEFTVGSMTNTGRRTNPRAANTPMIRIVSTNEIIGLVGLSSVAFTLIDKLSAPLWFSTGLSLLAFVLSYFIVVYSKWLEHDKVERKNRFEVCTDRGGASCLEDIRNADRSLLLTHFSSEVPDPVYLRAIQEKIDNGLHVNRLVSDSANINTTDYSWLKSIDRKTNYVQHKCSRPLPFNIIIIDNNIIWLFFPTEPSASHFNNAISIRSEVLSSHLKVVYDKLLSHSKRF